MTWVKIWSVLHGDMQLGTRPGAALRAVLNTKDISPCVMVTYAAKLSNCWELSDVETISN